MSKMVIPRDSLERIEKGPALDDKFSLLIERSHDFDMVEPDERKAFAKAIVALVVQEFAVYNRFGAKLRGGNGLVDEIKG